MSPKVSRDMWRAHENTEGSQKSVFTTVHRSTRTWKSRVINEIVCEVFKGERSLLLNLTNMHVCRLET